MKQRNLDYKQMVSDINDLVDNDWGLDMDCHFEPNSKPFTQDEAKELVRVLMEIYMISHAIYCSACGSKYLNK